MMLIMYSRQKKKKHDIALFRISELQIGLGYVLSFLHVCAKEIDVFTPSDQQSQVGSQVHQTASN